MALLWGLARDPVRNETDIRSAVLPWPGAGQTTAFPEYLNS